MIFGFIYLAAGDEGGPDADRTGVGDVLVRTFSR